jgi:hypothetical protein
VHQPVQRPEVGLTVLPAAERGDTIAQPRHLIRREYSPFTAVQDERKSGGLRDRFVIRSHPGLRRVAVRRRQDENRIGSRTFSSPCDVSANRGIEARARDHRHTTTYRSHGDADHVFDLMRREGEDLSHAAGCDKRAERVSRHSVNVDGQGVEIE